MAKPTAEKIELDETPFSTFVTRHVPETISFAFNATGAALAAGKQPPSIPKAPIKPAITDLEINPKTGQTAYPHRPKYPPKMPTPAEIEKAYEDGHTLVDYDLGMTEQAEKKFDADMKTYNSQVKERKADIKAANTDDLAAAQALLNMLGPRTLTLLNNTAEYKALKSTLAPDDHTQTTTSYQILNILRNLFQSGTPSDMIQSWRDLMNYTPTTTDTAPTVIESVNRMFDAATSRITSSDGTIQVDNLKTLVLLKTISALPGDFSSRAAHRAMIMPLPPDKFLPPSHAVAALLIEEMKMAGTIDKDNNAQSTQAAAFKATLLSSNQGQHNTKNNGTTRPKRLDIPCSFCLEIDKIERFYHTKDDCSKNPANKDNKKHSYNTDKTKHQKKVTGHIANLNSASPAPTTNSNSTASDTATELARLRGQTEAYQTMFQFANHHSDTQQHTSPSDASVMTTTI